MEDILQSHALYIASITGSVAFALSGFLAGVRKHLDIMGVFILAFLTANGGGVIRDLLVDRPPAILQNTEPFWLAAGVTIAAWVLGLQKLKSIEEQWFFVICDAVGLVASGITGSLIAIEYHVHFFGFMTLSFLTATGGGILRDLLINNVPEVLHAGFYGSVAILLGVTIYLLHYFAALNPVSLLVVFTLATSLRLIAYRYCWKLPKLG